MILQINEDAYPFYHKRKVKINRQSFFKTLYLIEMILTLKDNYSMDFDLKMTGNHSLDDSIIFWNSLGIT